jgi:hypothetical protein
MNWKGLGDHESAHPLRHVVTEEVRDLRAAPREVEIKLPHPQILRAMLKLHAPRLLGKGPVIERVASKAQERRQHNITRSLLTGFKDTGLKDPSTLRKVLGKRLQFLPTNK